MISPDTDGDASGKGEAMAEDAIARIAALSGAESFDQAATICANSGLTGFAACARICVCSQPHRHGRTIESGVLQLGAEGSIPFTRSNSIKSIEL